MSDADREELLAHCRIGHLRGLTAKLDAIANRSEAHARHVDHLRVLARDLRFEAFTEALGERSRAMSEPGGAVTILVVDDSPDTLHMLTDALEERAMTVLVATHADKALALAAEVAPDLILMDAMLPGIDGFEITRRLKADALTTAIPVIFMTGLSATDDMMRGFDAGGVDYVTKPVVIETLLARIRAQLAVTRQARASEEALAATGQNMLSLASDGRLLWCNAGASALLAEAAGPGDPMGWEPPETMRAWLAPVPEPGSSFVFALPKAENQALRFTFIGSRAPGRLLLSARAAR